MLLPLEKNVRFGLLCVACVPGGGLGHVAVIISDADIPLSLTMNLISTVTMLGKYGVVWVLYLQSYTTHQIFKYPKHTLYSDT